MKTKQLLWQHAETVIYSVSHKKTVWQTADRKMDIKIPQLKKSTHNDIQQHMPLPVITEIAPFLHK